MRHTLRTLLLLMLAGAVVAAAAYGAVQATQKKKRKAHVVRDLGRLGPPLFGFNDNSVLFEETDPVTAIRRSVHAGANVVRYSVNWDYIEQRKGQFNWNAYDPLYKEALANGIRPILIPVRAPGWTRPLDLSCGATARIHCPDPPGTSYDADWVNFVSTLARRYPKAAAIEIWNEPNLSNFWKQGPDAERYAHLLNLAYDAIKRAQPDMRVLGGALSNTQWGGNGSTPYEQYINDLLGSHPKLDALSVHDYVTGGSDEDWFVKTLDIARASLDSHGYTGVPLWVTEMGQSTGGDYGATPVMQATRLANRLHELGARKDVQAAVVHTLVPAPVDPASEEYGYSVLDPDGSPRTAYCLMAAGRRVKLPRGCER